jgi:hypothetical protein
MFEGIENQNRPDTIASDVQTVNILHTVYAETLPHITSDIPFFWKEGPEICKLLLALHAIGSYFIDGFFDGILIENFCKIIFNGLPHYPPSQNSSCGSTGSITPF